MSATASRSFTMLKNYNFFFYGTHALLMPFLPLYFQQIGFSPVQIGLLMAMGPIVLLVSNPFWGYWSDYFQNVKQMLLIMLIGTLLASQMIFQLDLFIPLILAMLLFFFFQTGVPTMNNTLILESIKNTSHQFGAFRLWGSLGFAVVSVIAGPIIESLGILNLGIFYGIFVLIPIFLCFWLPRQKNQRAGKTSLKGVSSLFANRYYAAFLFLSMLIAIPDAMNATFIALYLHDIGATSVFIGWSWFFASIGEVPIFLLLDRYLKLTSKSMVGMLMLVALLYSLRWILMGVVQSPWQILAIQMLHSFTFGVYVYIGTYLCSYLTPQNYQASGQAWYALFRKGLAGIISGLVGGWIYTTLGASGMYGIASIMALIGTMGFLLMWRQLANHVPKARSKGKTI